MNSFRNKFIIATLVIGSYFGVADAAPVIIFEAPLDRHQQVSADFAVNRKLGRAWIDVKVTTEDQGEGPPVDAIMMMMLEGLYYDSARKQVLYRTGSDPIVCAEDAAFLGKTYLKSTGRCLLSRRTDARRVDDGFEVRMQTVAQVLFDAQTPAAATGNR